MGARALDVVEHGEQLTGHLGLGAGDRGLAVTLHPAPVVRVLRRHALQVGGALLELGAQPRQLGVGLGGTGRRCLGARPRPVVGTPPTAASGSLVAVGGHALDGQPAGPAPFCGSGTDSSCRTCVGSCTVTSSSGPPRPAVGPGAAPVSDPVTASCRRRRSRRPPRRRHRPCAGGRRPSAPAASPPAAAGSRSPGRAPASRSRASPPRT